MTCKFCHVWRPKQSIFYNPSFELHFVWQYVLQQCFLCVIAFFVMFTEKIDVEEDVFFELVHYQCNFYIGFAIFTMFGKLCFEV